MRRTVLAALAALLTLPAGAAAHHEQAKVRYFANRCADSPTAAVLACIHRATLQRHIDYQQAKGIAWRESRYTPGICNPQPIYNGEHACGLFQFIPSTWASTPYAAKSIFSAKWSALAYAYMIRAGRCGEFATC